MYKKILLISIVAIQSSCATYKEPQGNSSTLALVKGSGYHKSFCEFGSTLLSEVDGKWIGEVWSGESVTKVMPGKHNFKLSSNIFTRCPPMGDHYLIDTDVTATLKAGNVYRVFGRETNGKIVVIISDQNGNQISVTQIGAEKSYTVPMPTTIHLAQ